jgi:hypothetical protein
MYHGGGWGHCYTGPNLLMISVLYCSTGMLLGWFLNGTALRDRNVTATNRKVSVSVNSTKSLAFRNGYFVLKSNVLSFCFCLA